MANKSKSKKSPPSLKLRRTSWQEKLAKSHGLPKVEKITAKQSKRWGSGMIVIPAPKEVDEIMKKVECGRLILINQIRMMLAKKHKATISCPITTGIFACIAARAAEEAKTEGKKDITPYWRTLKADGELNEKYPGGVISQAKHLKEEGHTIIKKGKKTVVENFEKFLVKI